MNLNKTANRAAAIVARQELWRCDESGKTSITVEVFDILDYDIDLHREAIKQNERLRDGLCKTR